MIYLRKRTIEGF